MVAYKQAPRQFIATVHCFLDRFFLYLLMMTVATVAEQTMYTNRNIVMPIVIPVPISIMTIVSMAVSVAVMMSVAVVPMMVAVVLPMAIIIVSMSTIVGTLCIKGL